MISARHLHLQLVPSEAAFHEHPFSQLLSKTYIEHQSVVNPGALQLFYPNFDGVVCHFFTNDGTDDGIPEVVPSWLKSVEDCTKWKVVRVVSERSWLSN